MKTVIFFLAFLAFSAAPAGRKTETEIGRWNSASGMISASIVTDGGEKFGYVHVCDQDIVNSVLFRVNQRQLRELRDLLTQQLNELEKR